MDRSIRQRATKGETAPELQSVGFSHFYRTHFPAYRQEHRTISGAGLTLVDSHQDRHDTVIAATPEWRLTQSWTGETPLRREIAGQWQEGTKPVGSFGLAPPNLAVPVQVLGRYRVRVLAIEAPRIEGYLRAVRAHACAIEGLVDRLALVDPLIAQLLDAFWTEAASGDALSSLLADSMTSTLSARLLRLAGHVAAQPGVPALTPRRLRRVLDVIDARLAEDLSLADLAQAGGLSPHHFARAFRGATGVSPYRYLLRERVARAKRLIAETDLSLVQIALDCGFSSQAHFTTVFRRLAGITPGRLRGHRRG